ncbi:MAG: hypothetical protein AAGJ70_06610, partial [Pseudomonadota bacterium]
HRHTTQKPGAQRIDVMGSAAHMLPVGTTWQGWPEIRRNLARLCCKTNGERRRAVWRGVMR